MAVTNLESIAEKIAEGKKKQLEEILSVSGSNAIKKNEYGVTTVEDTDSASSLIFKPLNRSKLNNDEIVKAIDVSIKELKPNIPVAVKDLVPKPLYDEQVKTNEDLRKQVETLTGTVTQLNGQITELKNKVDEEVNNRLNIEQTNNVLSNQSKTLGKTLEDFSGQIQNAIQKSVEESILRASLQAQNTGLRAQIEALIKQIDSLNSIIEGLQSQLGAVQQQQAIEQSASNLAVAAGGFVINEVAVVTFDPKPPNESGAQIYGAFNAKTGEKRWNHGGTVKITNNDTKPIKVKLSVKNYPAGVAFFSAPTNEITVNPNENKDIKLNLTSVPDNIDSKKRIIGYSGSGNYGAGIISVSVNRTADNTTKEKTFETAFDKRNPGSY